MVPSLVSTASSGAAAQRRRGRTQPLPPPMATVENPDRAACGRDWSALADLPLSVVAERLHSLKDFLAFRGVCRSWRSVGISVEGDVVASHPPLFFESDMKHFYHLGEKRFYKRKSPPMEEGSGDGLVRFYDQGEQRFCVPRPPLMLEGSAVVGHSYGHLILLKNDQPWLANPLTGAENRCFPRRRWLRQLYEATLSSPPSSPGCVLVVYDEHSIQYCSPGDERWFEVQWPRDDEGGYHIDWVSSVAVVGGKVYVWLKTAGLASFVFTRTHAPTLTIMHVHRPFPPTSTTRYRSMFKFSLVESRGELFAFSALMRPSTRCLGVVRPRVRYFAVFRFDTSSCKFVVSSQDFGDRALFMGHWTDALFVDNHGKWGSEDRIHLWDPIPRKPLKCKMNDLTSDDLTSNLPHRLAHTVAGLWVLPSLLSSTPP